MKQVLRLLITVSMTCLVFSGCQQDDSATPVDTSSDGIGTPSGPGETTLSVFATPMDSMTSTNSTAIKVGLLALQGENPTVPAATFEDLKDHVKLVKWPSRDVVKVSWVEEENRVQAGGDTAHERYLTASADELELNQTYAISLSKAPGDIRQVGGGFIQDPEGGWVSRFNRSAEPVLNSVGFCIDEAGVSEQLNVIFSEMVDLESDIAGAFELKTQGGESLGCTADTEPNSEEPFSSSVGLECSEPIQAGGNYSFTFNGGPTGYFVEEEFAPTFAEEVPFTVNFTVAEEATNTCLGIPLI